MKLEAIKRQAGRPGKNSAQVGQNFEGKTSRAQIAENSPDSSSQIQRYIRLNELEPELLHLVDEGKIGIRPAVELSYLRVEEQQNLFETIESEDAFPSHAQAIRMKELSRSGNLNVDQIFAIMTEQKGNQKEHVKIPMERLTAFFPRGTPPKRVEEVIIKALTYYRQRQRENRDAR
jgi:ParB family chromosome partitioning protein